MAFQLKTCLANPCSVSGLRLEYIDISGTYDATTNPTGYGVPGGPASPNSFTSYVLNIWFPKVDTSGTASYTVDLLAAGVPTPDSDGFYTWSFGPTDLGLTDITSGVYYAQATAVYSTDEPYIADTAGEFYQEVEMLFDTSLKNVNIDCQCRAGQNSVVELYALFQAIVCGGQCSATTWNASMDWFRFNLPTCPC